MSTLSDRIRGVLAGDRRRSGVPAPDAGQSRRTLDGHEHDLERVLGGEWRDIDGARSFVVEHRWDPSSRHGTETVETMVRRQEEGRDSVGLLIGASAGFPLVFFDLETTGLSGGAGTHAFLVGCGWFDESGAFVTRQYLLARFADERPLLTSVAREMARAGALVSFNGKSFDAPVLETRYLFHRLEWTGGRLPHLDMLHVGRRFWGRALGVESGTAGCSLIELERAVLGAARRGDVPGAEIPSRYFDFVRTGDPRPLKAILEHNRLDLVSLAALTTRVLHLVRVGQEHTHDAREALALGRVYDRAGFDGRARHAYERAIQLSAQGSQASEAVQVESLRALALSSRRSRSHVEAAGYWRRLLDLRGCPQRVAREASEALAIHHEHRMRDLRAAKAFALRSMEHESHRAWDDAARHRLARLDRKIERVKSQDPGLTFAEALDFRPET